MSTNGGIATAGANGVNGADAVESTPFPTPPNPRTPLHIGEQGAGTKHAAAMGLDRSGLAGLDGLDVTLRVEKNPSDSMGHTDGYGFSVPALDATGHKS